MRALTLVTACDGPTGRAALTLARSFVDASPGRSAIVVVADADPLSGGVRERDVHLFGPADVAGECGGLLAAALEPEQLVDALLPFALAHAQAPVVCGPAELATAAVPDAPVVVIDATGAAIALDADSGAAAATRWRERVLALDGGGAVADLRAAFPDAAVAQVELQPAGDHDAIGVPWGGDAFTSLPDGTPLSPRLRALFAQAWRSRALNASPFDEDGFRRFVDWLNGVPETRTDDVTRFLHRVWCDRPDLQEAFPAPGCDDRTAFLEWVEVHGRGEEAIPDWLAPARGDAAALRTRLLDRAAQRRIWTLEFQAALARVQRDSTARQLAPLVSGARARPWMHGEPFASRQHRVLGTVLGYREREDVSARDRYRRFEDVFRGPRERVLELLAGYVDLLKDHGPVIDIGAGRGELLQLLSEAGVQACGVDLDAGMVVAAQDRGIDITHGDAVAELQRLEPGTVGAVTAIHVIEHLTYDQLTALLRAARQALRPGGLLVCETINPHAPFALKTFWVDPTHQHPLFPEVMLIHAQTAGFGEAFVTYPRGRGDATSDWLDQDAYTLVATA